MLKGTLSPRTVSVIEEPLICVQPLKRKRSLHSFLYGSIVHCLLGLGYARAILVASVVDSRSSVSTQATQAGKHPGLATSIFAIIENTIR